MTKQDIKRMEELQKTLEEAADSYYNFDIEIISNYQYDALYDELVELENKTNTILENSITQKTGVSVSNASSGLKKVRHSSPMLSLNKTKEMSEVDKWLNDNDACLSWKLDGSTVVLTYKDGNFVHAVTRGDGHIGEDITKQAEFFLGVPLSLDISCDLTVRGEALMSYDEFNRINELCDADAQYKNPRNLASGTMRALDLDILRERKITFIAFNLVDYSDENHSNKNAINDKQQDIVDKSQLSSYSKRLDLLKELGFQVVEHEVVDASTVDYEMKAYEKRAAEYEYPVDGLVLFFDDIEYGDSLGITGHAPRNGLAFKWADEVEPTVLREIEWSPSRTGKLNPVAVFEPLELCGTTVSRASLHNLSFIEDMKLGIGDEITVYKANMIIPQVAKNMTESLKDIHDVLPDECPICGGKVKITKSSGIVASDYLECLNDKCPAKAIGSLERFCSRDGIWIQGFGANRLQVLLENGYISTPLDVMRLSTHRQDIIDNIEGFGEKLIASLLEAIDKARTVSLDKFISALGIQEVGKEAAKLIAEHFDYDVDAFLSAAESGKNEMFTDIKGLGTVSAENILSYFSEHHAFIRELSREFNFANDDESGIIDTYDNDSNLQENGTDEMMKRLKNVGTSLIPEHRKVNDSGYIDGKTICVTGSLETFKNRTELAKFISERGGRLVGSVSKKTDLLVTNTPDSGSSKNKKALEYGTTVMTELEFVEYAISGVTKKKKK